MRRLPTILLPALLVMILFGLTGFFACRNVCDTSVCHNNGLCVDGSCSCPVGYEGGFCDAKTRDKFIGEWIGSDLCSSGTYTTTLSIDSSVNDVYALVTNLRDFGSPVTIAGTVGSSSTLSFSNALVSSDRVLTGTMTFGGDASGIKTMHFVYTLTAGDGTSESCAGDYVRK